MQAIQSVISFMQNLGAACMMPIFVFSFAMVLCPCALPPQASMAVCAS